MDSWFMKLSRGDGGWRLGLETGDAEEGEFIIIIGRRTNGGCGSGRSGRSGKSGKSGISRSVDFLSWTDVKSIGEIE